jgi:integrase
MKANEVDMAALLQAIQDLKLQLAPPIPESPPFRELAALYLHRRFSPSNEPDAKLCVRRLVEIFGNHTSATLTEDVAIAGLASLVNGKNGEALKPRTKNKYRQYAIQIIKRAPKTAWPKQVPNPFRDIERHDEGERDPIVLEAPEIRRLLQCGSAYAPWYAFCVYAVIRPSEGKALLVSDVDWDARTYSITKTIYQATTKNRQLRRNRPIHSELWPFLLEQRERAWKLKDERLFPQTPNRHEWRADLRAAGILRGWRYSCRRSGCGFMFERKTREDGVRCERCNFRLTITPLHKPIRAYNLRHSAITLYTEAEASDLAIAAMAGHKRKNLTQTVYTATRTQWLRREIEKLRILAGATSCEQTASQGTLALTPGVEEGIS